MPATAESLQADLREMYRPDQEPVADYLTRISRIVLALRAHGVAVSSVELDRLTTKASLLAEEFGQVGGDWHPTRMVRSLRARFTAAALKEGDDGDDADVQKEIQAIGELILALGGKQSASADRSEAPLPMSLRGRRALRRRTDLVWPTLTDDKSDTKDVVLFYEEFEDVCALANNCRGMSAREKLLALRARCKGSRAKTYTNAYRAAWKTGEVVDDPEAVYLRIKNKHLMFGESREEREVRIDGEHQALVKGRLSGHQFEPLFEASVADLESVGLGKTARELYLSYLRKMPPHLQKEIRQDKRIWPGEAKEVGLRSPATWESLSTSNQKRLAEGRGSWHGLSVLPEDGLVQEGRELRHGAQSRALPPRITRSDLTEHEDLGARPSLFRRLPFQGGDPNNGRALQRHRRAGGYAVDELAVDPPLKLHHREPSIIGPYPELGRAVKHADQELLGDMVRPSAPVEHTLDAAAQHLNHSPVLVAAGLVLCQRAPVAWQLVERRETAALALLEGKGVLPHRSLRVGGRKARLNPGAAYLDAESSEGVAHGRSRGRAPVGRQGLPLPRRANLSTSWIP